MLADHCQFHIAFLKEMKDRIYGAFQTSQLKSEKKCNTGNLLIALFFHFLLKSQKDLVLLRIKNILAGLSTSH